MLLNLQDIHVKYGNVQALKGINVSVREGEIISIIGANGAGKSTLLKSIIGSVPCHTGRIEFEGRPITHDESHKRVEQRISLVPEGRQIFADMTVRENLETGFYPNRDKKSFKPLLEKVYALYPILQEREKQTAGSLSGGQQQMLAIGRGLMNNPKLLMLDEPSLGLAPIVIQELGETLRQLNREGLTIILVEQNAIMALRLSDRAYVLETGNLVLEGTGRELLENENVKKAYLGM